MDYAQIAQQVVEGLKPVLMTQGAHLATAVGAHGIYDWLKSKFTSGGAAEALADVRKDPTREVNWDALRVQIRKALEEDEGFRKELLGKLGVPQQALSVTQQASVMGNANTVIQNTGKGFSMK